MHNAAAEARRGNDGRLQTGAPTRGCLQPDSSVMPSFAFKPSGNGSNQEKDDRDWEENVNQQGHGHSDEKLRCCEICYHGFLRNAGRFMPPNEQRSQAGPLTPSTPRDALPALADASGYEQKPL